MRIRQWNQPKIAELQKTFSEGTSLAEWIAVLSVTGVLAAIITPSISLGRESLHDSTHRVSSLMKMARTKARAQTSAVKVTPNSSNGLTVTRAETCTSTTWKAVPGIADAEKELDAGITFASASLDGTDVDAANGWSICFNNRGIASKTLDLSLFNSKKNQYKQVQVFRGGTIYVNP